MYRCRIFILLVACLAVTSGTKVARGQSLTSLPSNVIAGHIRDAETDRPISLVNITLAGTNFWTFTNETGDFEIPDLPPGRYTLRATHIGYARVDYVDLEVAAEQGFLLDIVMTPKAIRLREIVVSPGSFSFMDGASATRQTMSREDMQMVPQLGEDVFRAVNRLPGLSSGDYSAHFSIRGGRHDETLILLDGLEIYEPYHLKDFNEGAISIIDVETIEGLELMTGGFPSKFGNKRSGVFSIDSKRSGRDRARYNLGLSFMNARAMAEGGYADGKGSWFVSARSGYMDLVFALIKQNDLPSPRYHDIFAKTTYRLHPNHVLSLDLLHAGDTYSFDAAGTTGINDSLATRELASNRYGNSYAWASLNSTLGERTTVRTIASAGLVSRNRDGSEKYLTRPDPLYTVVNKRDFSILGLKQDWTREQSSAWIVDFGFDVRALDFSSRLTSEVGADPNNPASDSLAYYPVITSMAKNKSGNTLAVYLSNRLRLVDPLVLELGYRYDRASYTGDSDFSPRANALLTLGTGRTLRVGWGQYRQIQGIEDVAFLNDDNRYFPAELSEQWTAGFEQEFANGATVRVEGYVKNGSHLRSLYRNWKGGIDVFPESNEDRILVQPKSSESRGIEVYYDQKLSEKVTIRGSYALAKTEETVLAMENINDPTPLLFDITHPGPQDQRHSINLDSTYRLGRSWSINGSFSFHSGWPATHERLVEVTDDEGSTDLAVLPDRIYGARLPSYQRLDVRATRTWQTSHGQVRAFLEIVNLTNHRNVFGYDYWRGAGRPGEVLLHRDPEQWFTLLPSIGVSWTGDF